VACKYKTGLISLLSLKDFMAFNSFLVMLGMEDLDFSNMDLIFHLSSMLRVCGSFEITDSTAQAMSRLEWGFATEKFIPFIRIASSESVRTCLERLWMNFLELEADVDDTLFCWL
jgi:hypothetical protein